MMTKLLQFISQVKIYVPFQVHNKPLANGKKKNIEASKMAIVLHNFVKNS